MTEKEKMLAGEYYNPADEELLKTWHQAKSLMKEYNMSEMKNREHMDALLRELLGSKGENVWITPPFFVDYGKNIHIGNNCEINMNCVFLDCNTITIGDNTGIGPAVQIYAVTHPVNPAERLYSSGNADFPTCWRISSAPVTIGSNVWIGGGSIILQGVAIGDNSVIAAGSVVTKSIPANVLAAGNPCKVIREI